MTLETTLTMTDLCDIVKDHLSKKLNVEVEHVDLDNTDRGLNVKFMVKESDDSHTVNGQSNYSDDIFFAVTIGNEIRYLNMHHMPKSGICKDTSLITAVLNGESVKMACNIKSQLSCSIETAHEIVNEYRTQLLSYAKDIEGL